MNLFPYAFAVLFFTGVILLKRACDQEVKDGEKVKNVRFGGARGLLAVEYISLALLAAYIFLCVVPFRREDGGVSSPVFLLFFRGVV